MNAEVESVRIDRWLWAARIYASRTLAQRACDGGHVKLNGVSVKASHPLKVGDRVTARAPRGHVILDVAELEVKRQGAQRARQLYEDHSPPPPPREERMPARLRGAGRPTKAERRAFDRMRGEG